jgi:hypothetical protein
MVSRKTGGSRRKTDLSFEVISVHGISNREKAKVTTVFPLRANGIIMIIQIIYQKR